MTEIEDFFGGEQLLQVVNELLGRFPLVMVVCCGEGAGVWFLDSGFSQDGAVEVFGKVVLEDPGGFGLVVGVEELVFRSFLMGYPRARGLDLFSGCRRLELDRGRMEVVMERLALLRREGVEGASLERVGLFFSLFLLEVVEGKIGFEQTVSDGRELMGRFLELLEVHYLDQGKAFRRSGFYAGKLGLSSLRLDGLCKVWFGGKGFAEVHRERLLSQAEFLLLGSDRSIKEIAYELNFCSQQHFRSYFVRNRGVSPLAFRRAHLLGGG